MIRARTGAGHRPARGATHVRDLSAVRESLGNDDTEFVIGESLTVGEALAIHDRLRGARDRPSVGWDSLTPTELEVTKLVALGRINPQIAEQLLMGRETVKTHVSSALRKLGLTNRTELAAAAVRRP